MKSGIKTGLIILLLLQLFSYLLFMRPAFAVTAFFEQFSRAEQAFAQGRRQQAVEEYLVFVQNFHSYYSHPPYLDSSRQPVSTRGEALSLQRRQSLHHAYLRLVQLALRPQNKSHWLRQALAMAARAPYADLKPDVQLFPPPIVQQYYTVQKSFQLKAGEQLKTGEQLTRPSRKGRAAELVKTAKNNKLRHLSSQKASTKRSQTRRAPARRAQARKAQTRKTQKFETQARAHQGPKRDWSHFPLEQGETQKHGATSSTSVRWLKRIGVAALVAVGVGYSYHYLTKNRGQAQQRSYQEGF